MPETDDPVELFRSAVVTLTTKGNVEEYIRPIIYQLNNGNNDMEVLNQLIDILFNHVSLHGFPFISFITQYGPSVDKYIFR